MAPPHGQPRHGADLGGLLWAAAHLPGTRAHRFLALSRVPALVPTRTPSGCSSGSSSGGWARPSTPRLSSSRSESAGCCGSTCCSRGPLTRSPPGRAYSSHPPAHPLTLRHPRRAACRRPPSRTAHRSARLQVLVHVCVLPAAGAGDPRLHDFQGRAVCAVGPTVLLHHRAAARR